ncbi:MAG TPA: YceI family protein [Gammaproteobacteria bacterium]|nr:YceI family protein [Gammaproteobacteria bacterium]
MKFLFFCFILLFSLPVLADEYKQYTFDPEHSYVEWSVSHFGFSHDTGKFYVEGVLVGDPKNPAHAGITVIIPIATLSTGIKAFDTLLWSKNFFDMDNFPKAFFRSSKVEITGPDTAKIYGTLSVRSAYTPVVLNVKLEKHAVHPYHHKDAFGFSGTASFNRSDLGMLGYLPGVSDNVDVHFEVEAILNDQPAPANH